MAAPSSIFYARYRFVIKFVEVCLAVACLVIVFSRWRLRVTCGYEVSLEVAMAISFLLFILNVEIFVAYFLHRYYPKCEFFVLVGSSLASLTFNVCLIFYGRQSKEGMILIVVGLNSAMLTLLVYELITLCFFNQLYNCFQKSKSEPGKAPGEPNTALSHQSKENRPPCVKDKNYYDASCFQHKGNLKIPKQPNFELSSLNSEKDELPPDAAIKFTEDDNVVYDIGSEVEQVIE